MPEYLFDLNQTNLPAVQIIASYHGLRLADTHLEIFLEPEDEAWAAEYSRRWDENSRVVVLCPDWKQVVGLLDGEVTLLELSGEPTVLDASHALGYLPICRTAALLRRVDCVLGVDSFPAHLAAAIGTPAVVLFGPTNSLLLQQQQK